MDEKYQKIQLNDGGFIPSIGFGTGTTYFNRPDDVSEGLVKAVNAGFTLLDTAVMYGTEVGVGKGVTKIVTDGICKRENLFITTKLAPTFLSSQETVKSGHNCLEMGGNHNFQRRFCFMLDSNVFLIGPSLSDC